MSPSFVGTHLLSPSPLTTRFAERPLNENNGEICERRPTVSGRVLDGILPMALASTRIHGRCAICSVRNGDHSILHREIDMNGHSTLAVVIVGDVKSVQGTARTAERVVVQRDVLMIVACGIAPSIEVPLRPECVPVVHADVLGAAIVELRLEIGERFCH